MQFDSARSSMSILTAEQIAGGHLYAQPEEIIEAWQLLHNEYLKGNVAKSYSLFTILENQKK